MRRALASMVRGALHARRSSGLRALEFRFWGPVISQAEEIAPPSLFALHAGGWRRSRLLRPARAVAPVRKGE